MRIYRTGGTLEYKQESIFSSFNFINIRIHLSKTSLSPTFQSSNSKREFIHFRTFSLSSNKFLLSFQYLTEFHRNVLDIFRNINPVATRKNLINYLLRELASKFLNVE